jgi:hypothetical protein
VVADGACRLADGRVIGPRQRHRRGHHVPVDVATCAERRGELVVDGADHGAQVLLRDEVQLDALAGREPDRALAEPLREAVQREPEPWVDVAARQAQAHHEAERELVAAPSPRRALVTIVLLVRAVELQDLIGLVADVRPTGREFLDERMTELVAGGLDAFDGGRTAWSGRGIVGHACLGLSARVGADEGRRMPSDGMSLRER